MSENQAESLAGQYLTFSLREAEYALEIARVREVLDLATLTKIPRMPDFLSGVINLRGQVVPVLDLGQRLGLAPIAKTINTSIVIVEVREGESSLVVGAMTDAVKMVVDLADENIEPVPALGTNLKTEFIKGMGKQQDKFMVILNIDKVLTNNEE